jgi:hypothetical protein
LDLTRRNTFPDVRHRFTIIGSLLMVVIGLLFAAGQAHAGVTGQLGDAWGGAFGTGPGQFITPHQLGVDPIDGSVYIGSPTNEFSETLIQKFSPTGELKGSVTVPGLAVIGIAVDHETVEGQSESGRFYVLEQEESSTPGKFKATKILAFKTTPEAGGALPAAGELPVPDPSSANALWRPQELVVDPHSGELIILAEDATNHAVIQAVKTGGGGSLGERWVDSSSSLGGSIVNNQRAIAVDAKGLIYVIAAAESGSDTRALTLPANFTAASTLTPVPGFTTAVPNAGLEFHSQYASTEEALGWGFGPQIAVSSSASGEDTLYWKTQASNCADDRCEILVNGFSVSGEARTTVWGGGSVEGECKIEAGRSALGIGQGGSVVVFSQGEEEFEGNLTYFPIVSRFGAGGSGCTAPEPALKVESEGHAVTSVPAGKAVTLNGSGSELHGATLAKTTWKVTGAETFSTESSSLSTVATGHFAAEGKYTIWMTVETSPFKARAKTFSAGPVTLEVTAGSGSGEVAPTITSFTPTKGTTGTAVTITGTEFTHATKVEFGGTAVSGCSATPGGDCTITDGTHIAVKAPAGIASGTKVKLTVTNGAGTSSQSSEEFEYEKSVASDHKLVITKVGEGTGSVACNGGACAAEYQGGVSVTLTATPASGSTFAGWEGAGCSGTGTCTIVIGLSDVAVVAKFNKASVTPPVTTPPVTTPPTHTPPSNSATPGSAKSSGSTVTLKVNVPGPGTVAASGKGLVGAKVDAKGAGAVQLKLKLTSTEKKTLAKKGTVKVKVKIVFTPTGGSPGTTTKTITFKAAKKKTKG